jgi:hypothetical protein
MQLIYAADFEVRGDLAPSDRHEAITGHLVNWLTAGSANRLEVDVLTESGNVVLEPVDGQAHAIQRTAAWEVVDAGDLRALRLALSQEVASGVQLTTRVTVTTGATTSLRVAIGRELTGGFLSPASDTPVFQPGFLGSVVRDRRLTLYVGTQRLDERYLGIRSSPEVEVLAEGLRTAQRLPTVLIHVRTPEAWDLARVLSSKLVGLARIITLNHQTSGLLNSLLPEVDLPFGGLQMLWSDITARAVKFTASDLERLKVEGVRSQLMSRLAAASVLARGEDHGWRLVTEATQAARRRAADLAVKKATDSQDYPAQVAALLEQVALLSGELVVAFQLAEEADARRAEAETLASTSQLAQQNADYWREQFELVSSSTASNVVTDIWETVPNLLPRTTPAPTFRALEDAAQGRIVFTDAAERSWKAISYPDPEDMTAKLTLLARAAEQLYSSSDNVIGLMDKWFYETFGLKVALSDQTISRTPGLRAFEFEGRAFSQIPHVKVRDAVKPNEVGRIHFDFDKEERRLVINHVAVKLYNS